MISNASPDLKAGETRLHGLRQHYANMPTADLLRSFIVVEFPQRIAVVSSFGAEAATLLHLTAQIEPRTPIIFINSGKLFGETLRYRDVLQSRLGLTDVRTIMPHPAAVEREDPRGMLHAESAERCCALRKVQPLIRGLEPFDAWISGRKRFQSSERASLEQIEFADGKFKLNPLADWTKDDIDAYCAKHDLPSHPLVKEGYLSIGCMPCTDRVAPGEDSRSGRWRGQSKSECGIHNMTQALTSASDSGV